MVKTAIVCNFRNSIIVYTRLKVLRNHAVTSSTHSTNGDNGAICYLQDTKFRALNYLRVMSAQEKSYLGISIPEIILLIWEFVT